MSDYTVRLAVLALTLLAAISLIFTPDEEATKYIVAGVVPAIAALINTQPPRNTPGR